MPSVPADMYVSLPIVKKSRSECGLPVGIVVISSQSASSPPARISDESGSDGAVNTGAA